MSVPSSGPVAFTDIQTVYGGVEPIALNEYYAGGPFVPNPPPTSIAQIGQIPTSGAISVGNFLGTLPTFIFNDTVSASTIYGYNLRNKAIAAGWDGVRTLKATVIINYGVSIIGGFDVGAIASTSDVTIYNYGNLIGYGGAGSDGVYTLTGGHGGPGFTTSVPVKLYNFGGIYGGGGGGGFGQHADDWKSSYASFGGGGGGGGGGGRGQGGNASAISPVLVYNEIVYGTNGANGSDWAGGAGGAGGSAAGGTGGAGGRGGDVAEYGREGGWASASGWDTNSRIGGNPGNAVVGGAYITWHNTGFLGGFIDNYGTFGGTGANSFAIAQNYKNVIFSYDRSTPYGNVVWWPTASNNQGIVSYTFCGVFTNTTASNIVGKLRGIIDDAVTQIRVNGVSVFSGATLTYTYVADSPTFNLVPGLNQVEIVCANTVNDSPAYMRIDMRDTSNNILIPVNCWRQA